jgi:hypothetical protein
MDPEAMEAEDWQLEEEESVEFIVPRQQLVDLQLAQVQQQERERDERRMYAYTERAVRWMLMQQTNTILDEITSSVVPFWNLARVLWPTCDSRMFSSKFGCCPEVFGRMWLRYEDEFRQSDLKPFDILATFNWLAQNSALDSLAADWSMPRSSYHDLVWKTVAIMYEVLDEISWGRCAWHEDEEIHPPQGHLFHKITFIIDGIECGLAKPADPIEEHAWFSGKFGGNSVKYEVACSLSTDRIMWISGGISGAYHDTTLSRASGLLNIIPEGELGLADAGYTGLDRRIRCVLRHEPDQYGRPSLTKEEWEYNRAVAALRIEVERVNGRLKRFQGLVHSRIRSRRSHRMVFYLLANFVNIWSEVQPLRAEKHPILLDCPFPMPLRAL